MADNSGIIDAAIINFPATLQQNALRATQIQNAQQIQQQNALKLQQQQAGINALRNAYSSNQFDPQTGLPSALAMSSLIAADPNLGLDLADARAKQQEYAIRARTQQIVANDHYTKMFADGVVAPLLDEYNQLPSNMPQEEKDRWLQQHKADLVKQTVQANGVPPDIADRFNNIPVSSQNLSTWAMQSDLVQKRQQQIQKGWQDHTDSTGIEYSTNDMYPGHYFNSSHEPMPPDFQPTGMKYQKPEFENYADKKTGAPITYDKNTNTYYDANHREIRPDARNLVKIGAKETVKTPEMVRVPDPTQPTGTRPVLATPPSTPGGAWTDQNNNPIPAPVSKIGPNDLDSPGATPMSEAARTYMSERERLGLHMNAAWATSKYLPEMAEEDVRNSLNLPPDHKLTREDALAAAMNDVVVQHGMKSESQALTNIARLNSNVGNFEGTALRNANLVEQLGPKGSAGGDLLWNRFRNASRREIGIDPDLSKLDLAVTDLKNEYVRIMSTAAGTGSMTSDQARSEGDRLFNTNLSWPVMQANLATARQTMANRVDSVRAQYNATLDSIRNKGAFAEQPALSATAGQEGSASRPPTMPDADKAKLPHDGSPVWYKGVGTRLGSGGVVQFFIDGKWQ